VTPPRPTVGALARIGQQYLPRTRSGRALGLAAAVDSVGSGLLLATLPIFVITQLHVTPLNVGVVVGTANLVGLLAPVPAGLVADRLGAGRSWTALLLARAIGYSGFLFVDSLLSYAVLAAVLSLLDRASTPVQQAFVTQVEPVVERTRSMAVLRTARNAGLSVGLLAAGLVIAAGGRGPFLVGFGVNAASYLVLMAVVRRLDRGRRSAPPRPVAADAPVTPEAGSGVWRDGRYLLMAAGNLLMTLHDSVLSTLLPLWIITRTSVPPAVVGPLLAVNTVLTVVLQVPLTRWADGVSPARRTVLRSLLPLVGSCVLFAVAEPADARLATALAVAAILLLSLGENMHSAAEFELSHRLAPDWAMGSYLGVFNLGWSAQLAIGPPFMTAVVLRGPPGWTALAGAFAVGTVAMMVGSRRRRTRPLD
jgi:MFS family permease